MNGSLALSLFGCLCVFSWDESTWPELPPPADISLDLKAFWGKKKFKIAQMSVFACNLKFHLENQFYCFHFLNPTSQPFLLWVVPIVFEISWPHDSRDNGWCRCRTLLSTARKCTKGMRGRSEEMTEGAQYTVVFSDHGYCALKTAPDLSGTNRKQSRMLLGPRWLTC